MRKVPIVPTVFALSLAMGVAALAADDDSMPADAPHGQWRPITEIVEQFTAMGYQVLGIENDDNLYEVEAIDANSLWVKAYVHPVSGEMLKERRDDD
jgi:Peptidase propeptide and YPEB domain